MNTLDAPSGQQGGAGHAANAFTEEPFLPEGHLAFMKYINKRNGRIE